MIGIDRQHSFEALERSGTLTEFFVQQTEVVVRRHPIRIDLERTCEGSAGLVVALEVTQHHTQIAPRIRGTVDSQIDRRSIRIGRFIGAAGTAQIEAPIEMRRCEARLQHA